MDGEAFDVLIASRAMPALGDAVRPAHMAMLRRCWNANKPFAAAVPCKAGPCEQGPALPRFSPPPRRETDTPEPEPQEEHRHPCEFQSPEHETENGHLTSTPLSSAMMKQKAAKPPQVPRLDLSFVHQKGNSENLMKHEWKPGRQSNAGSGADMANRSGFASASPEDQQRIAEFYGYRDEGFVATMAGLRTDLLRPRL
ncbi:Dusp3 [Symbiodinium sp. CCMP2592]|nr:Dusp3 [Symbiodinium sp. CCMP2592]